MQYQNIVIFSLLILLLQCVYYLYRATGHISRSYYSFQIIFMCIAPVLQIYHGKTFWGLPQPSIFAILLSNYLLFFSNFLLFKLTIRNKYIFSEKIKHLVLILKGEVVEGHSRFEYPLKLVTMSFVACLLWIYVFGLPTLDQLMYRISADSSSGIHLSGVASLIFETVRYVPFFAFIVYRLNYKRKTHLNIFFLVVILYLFPPMAISRFNLGVIYLTLLIILFPSLLKGFRVHLLLFVGFFTAFPISDLFRYKGAPGIGGVVKSPFSDITSIFSFDYLLTESFDTYNSLVTVVDQNIVTYGYQLLGVIFFFIPREFWDSKPVGSGAYIAALNDLDWRNISLNYYGEAFINFGYIGVLLFVLILGLSIRYLELIDLRMLTSRRKFNMFVIFYLIMVPYIFFIMRGDLLSSVSYLASMGVAVIITIFIEVKFTWKHN
jgi:hypothetical protein